MTHLRSENQEVTGRTRIAGTVSGRVHVPSGAVLDLAGVALDGVALDGVALDRVVVTAGGRAAISGTTRSLTIAVGGRAILTGTCLGPVINDGRDLTIEGVVEGPVVEHAGRTVISPAASIGGRNPGFRGASI